MNFEKNIFNVKKQASVEAEIKKPDLNQDLKNEHVIEKQEFFDNLLDKVILDNYHKINSGQNGVVGLFDLKQVKQSFIDRTKILLEIDENDLSKTTEDLELIFANRFGAIPDNDDKLAIKILKIFSEKSGNHEAMMQQRAYEIIEQAKADNPEKQFAGVPRVYFNKTVDLIKEPEILKKLKIDDVDVHRQAYVMAMDYYEGEDFAEHLYRSALADVGGVDEAEIKALSFEELKKQVATLKIPGMLSNNSPVNRLTPLQTYRQNNKVLLERYSKEHGLIDEVIFEKVDNTVKALNGKGFYHRDLHERNIFLSKQDGKITDAHVIDFATAQEIDKPVRLENIYKDASREYIRDGYFVASYKNLGRESE